MIVGMANTKQSGPYEYRGANHDLPDLRDIAGYTQQITHLTKKRAQIGEKRKAAAQRHHFEEGIAVAQLAKAMGISPTAAYRLVHGDGSKNAPRRAE